jgi:crossover junction endodeoxyribonuclease RuvC
VIILGIDPGSRKTGFGIIEKKGRKLSYIHSEVRKFPEPKELLLRLPQIYQATYEIINKFEPDCIVIESLIYVKSPTALIKLAQTRGVILSAAFECGYTGKIFEYSPNLVKSQTTGHGHSDKLAGQKFLDMALGKRIYQTDDESDALLVAMCHGFQENRGMASSGKSKLSGLAASVSHKI